MTTWSCRHKGKRMADFQLIEQLAKPPWDSWGQMQEICGQRNCQGRGEVGIANLFRNKLRNYWGCFSMTKQSFAQDVSRSDWYYRASSDQKKARPPNFMHKAWLLADKTDHFDNCQAVTDKRISGCNSDPQARYKFNLQTGG